VSDRQTQAFVEAPKLWRGTPTRQPRSSTERQAWETYSKIVDLEEKVALGRLSLTAAHSSIVDLALAAFRLASDVPDLQFFLAQSLQPLSFTDPSARDLMQRARQRLDQLGGPSAEVLESDANVIALEIHHRRVVAEGLPVPTLDPRTHNR
jgi:hypothetical protein